MYAAYFGLKQEPFSIAPDPRLLFMSERHREALAHLLYGVQGGIYLAGGILPQIREFVLQSTFVERFLNKGPMREALERIPVKLVEHGQLGVIGAANWYLSGAGARAPLQ